MLTIRKGDDRGRADHGWLRARHTFSFADYFDPQHVHFRSLRVMNEDRVAPTMGFDMHPHRDMEIVTYVLAGLLQHRDNLGNTSTLRAGEWQHMTAGTGVMHSEFNPSADQWTHLYQIWLLPDRKGLKPEYEQRSFETEMTANAWRLIAAPDRRDGALGIHQDAELWTAKLTAGAELTKSLQSGRHGWLQVLRGSVEAGGNAAAAGDGLAVSEEESLALKALESAEVLWFDLG